MTQGKMKNVKRIPAGKDHNTKSRHRRALPVILG